MNTERLEERMEDKYERRGIKSDKGHLWTGAALLIIGGLFLAREAGILFPRWFFTWPMILVGIGLFTGIRHRFNNPAPFILLIIGGIFLADEISPDFTLKQYVWPLLLITLGLFFIFRPRSRRHRSQMDNEPQPRTTEDNTRWEQAMVDQRDVLDVTAIFGGVKKNILTKNFKGGEIVCVMGGAEINLTQADFQGKVIIDSFNMFGGTKIIVPPDWDVQSQVVAIFGGVDDKRPPSAHVDHSKILYLDGTCIFGGVEIRSF